MRSFAERTGLCSSRSQQRYLWTDAFAVCNFLELQRETGDASFLELALQLIEAVHETLGRYRHDDRDHSGWISGLSDKQGALHPTRGGLRIGKPLPERAEGESFDPELEWDRDGQYFHYLTKWMHALDQVARQTGEARFNLWARELAERACGAFIYRTPTDARRMYWKMSIDLTRPLVASMGQHDPLDGFVTCAELCVTAARLNASDGPGLAQERAELAALSRRLELATVDPLGIGGLLLDACRISQLGRIQTIEIPSLLERVVAAAELGLRNYFECGELRRPESERLAFRELGLAIGLHAPEFMADAPGRLVDALDRYASRAAALETAWSATEQRTASSWLAHRDINEVMLASSLLPGAVLDLERGR